MVVIDSIHTRLMSHIHIISNLTYFSFNGIFNETVASHWQPYLSQAKMGLHILRKLVNKLFAWKTLMGTFSSMQNQPMGCTFHVNITNECIEGVCPSALPGLASNAQIVQHN